ncbi:hypothetical protein [Streptomyces sp. PT12]|uniref:hypothetical protein n=1 Tax=Streptomyces sp. PT12 TaxID=1510197 RepID=UPI000DE55A17|nr:hypothetical protein [Streptomyces sp. PT12]RBM20388.1 hypothetical protein DEH69_08005 [Streptomyces sp. PT12]
MRYAWAAAGLVMAIACSSCTGDSEEATREYSIPDPLCHLPVDEALISPLLPPGEELTIDPEFPEPVSGIMGSIADCGLVVDGTQAVHLRATPTDSGDGPPGVQAFLDREGENRTLADGQTSAAGAGEVVAWNDYAAMHVPCAASSLDYTGLNFSIELRWAEGQDHRDALAQAIGPLMDAFLARQGPGTCDTA